MQNRLSYARLKINRIGQNAEHCLHLNKRKQLQANKILWEEYFAIWFTQENLYNIEGEYVLNVDIYCLYG